MVAEYATTHTRHFGVSQQSCYFGRSQHLQIEETKSDEDVPMESEEKGTRKFVYTATTLRLMEQIAQAISQNESTLLVGETGTGKTTSV